MKRISVISQFSVSVFLVTGVLIFGVISPFARATVSSYIDVSPRTSGIGTQASLLSSRSVSGDGRYVVFSSDAANFISGDTNGVSDVFARDTVSNVTTRVSVSSSGTEANSYSQYVSIDYSGRYIVFTSTADNLTSGVTGTSAQHVYMRDMTTGVTTLVDKSVSGVVSSGSSWNPKVSAGGRFVVFNGTATNLVTGINSPTVDQIYIKDMHTGAIKALSVTSAGVQGNNSSVVPDISCDGNVVTFTSAATNLGVPSGQPGRHDMIVVSLGWSGDELNNVTSATQYGINPGSSQISCNGNVALFVSSSTDVVSPSTPSGYANAYVYNRLSGTVGQVSLGNGNTQANSFQQYKDLKASISDDGRYVAFSSSATNVDTTYPNGADSSNEGNVYIRDMKKSTTEMITVLPTGNRSGWLSQAAPVSMSADGSMVVFPYQVPSTTNSYRSLISGYSSGSSSSYSNIFGAKTNY